MRHPEHHKIHRSGWLRAAVLGSNDGIVSTASLIVGVAAAGSSRENIILAGTAGLVAGAMAMAAGEYVSVKSQEDTERADLKMESDALGPRLPETIIARCTLELIDQYSRATIEFSLTWNSDSATHIEKLYANPVSFWRDVLDPNLVKGLRGGSVGDRALVQIPMDRFPNPYDARKRVLIQPDQFQGADRLIPVPGRFYPQGMLSGVGGVYKESGRPCRFLGQEGDRLVFDLNHPLAGRDLTLQAEIVRIHPPQRERGGRCEDWLEQVSADGPGMQAPLAGQDGALFKEENFQRQDEQLDSIFYQHPRLVHHLDSTARREIGNQYARLIRPGSQVLDLMGSWTSHLPDDLELEGLTVLGMNLEELQQNGRSTETLLQDLNIEPLLPFEGASFDAVICTASVEYLINPLAVMAEIKRILRPGGLLAFAFSNRWFPPKAIRIWADLHEFERLGLVADLFYTGGGFGGITTLSHRGLPRQKDDPYQDRWFSDPVYMVWGYCA